MKKITYVEWLQMKAPERTELYANYTVRWLHDDPYNLTLIPREETENA